MSFDLLQVEQLPAGGYEVTLVCHGKTESTLCPDVESMKRQTVAYIGAAAARTARLHSELSVDVEEIYVRR